MEENNNTNTNVPAVQAYSPVELTAIFRTYFSHKIKNGVIWVRGIYFQRQNNNPQWAYAYDDLRDVNSSASITLKISHNDRARLKSNSLVQLGGLVEFNSSNNGNIQLLFNVTRIEIVKDEFVTEQDLKRDEIRQRKNKKGYRNVDAELENILFKDARPKILLVFAGSSITQNDFRSGLQAAASKIDFTEESQSFGNAAVLSSYLKDADERGYDAIAIVRGGGAGIEALDAIEVLETVAEMKTPIISAIGHVDERLFFKTLADKEVPVPHGLGTYFKDMVEKVAEKRNSSRAVLVQEVQKQFKKQIDDSNKKNKELLEQVDKLQKQSKEQSKAFNENLAKVQKQNKETVESLQKQNKESIEKLTRQNDGNLAKVQKQNRETVEKIQKENKENIEKLNKQNADNLAKIQSQHQKTIESINKTNKDSLDRMEKTNGDLQKSLDKVNEKNEKLARDLANAKNGVTMPIAVLIALALAAIGFFVGILVK